MVGLTKAGEEPSPPSLSVSSSSSTAFVKPAVHGLAAAVMHSYSDKKPQTTAVSTAGHGYTGQGQTVSTVCLVWAGIASHPSWLLVGIRMGPTAAGRPPLSASGRTNEDDNKVADKMREDEDKELRWKDSGDMSSAVKTP